MKGDAMLTKHVYLPKTLTLDGVKYHLEWDSNGNMDAWTARFNIGRTFSASPDDEGVSELEWFMNRNNELASVPFVAYPNGDIICTIKA